MPFSKRTKKDNSVSHAMGISDKREDEIRDTVLKILKNDETISENLKELFDTIETDNELLFAVFQYGALLGQVRAHAENPIKLIEKMIEELEK